MPGHHVIEVNEHLNMINNVCGIYPLLQPVQKIFTTGLHWNLDGDMLAMNTKVSTSMYLRCTVIYQCTSI